MVQLWHRSIFGCNLLHFMTGRGIAHLQAYMCVFAQLVWFDGQCIAFAGDRPLPTGRGTSGTCWQDPMPCCSRFSYRCVSGISYVCSPFLGNKQWHIGAASVTCAWQHRTIPGGPSHRPGGEYNICVCFCRSWQAAVLKAFSQCFVI